MKSPDKKLTKQQEKDKFENIAKKLECDTSPDALDKAFDCLDFSIPKKSQKNKKNDVK